MSVESAFHSVEKRLKDPFGFVVGTNEADKAGLRQLFRPCFTVKLKNVLRLYNWSFQYEKFRLKYCGKTKFRYEEKEQFLQELEKFEPVKPYCWDPLVCVRCLLKRRLTTNKTNCCTLLLQGFMLLLFFPIVMMLVALYVLFLILTFPFNVLAYVWQLIKFIIGSVFNLLLGCLRICFKKYMCKKVKTYDDLARACRKVAYSCNTSSSYYDSTRTATKLLGFGRAMNLIQEFIADSSKSRDFVGVLNGEHGTYDEFGNTLKAFAEKEQQLRTDFEHRIPQAMFKNLFGKFVKVGVDVEKYSFFDYDKDDMNSLKERVLKCQKTTLQKISGFRKQRIRLKDGIPHTLREDVEELLKTSVIDFHIKTCESVEDKIIRKVKEKEQEVLEQLEKGSDQTVARTIKLEDLVRCRVVVEDVHEIWGSVISSVARGIDKCNFSGVKIKLKQPKEQYKDLRRTRWYGLYLFLYYDGYPVEVQVMTVRSIFSLGTKASGDGHHKLRGEVVPDDLTQHEKETLIETIRELEEELKAYRNDI